MCDSIDIDPVLRDFALKYFMVDARPQWYVSEIIFGDAPQSTAVILMVPSRGVHTSISLRDYPWETILSASETGRERLGTMLRLELLETIEHELTVFDITNRDSLANFQLDCRQVGYGPPAGGPYTIFIGEVSPDGHCPVQFVSSCSWHRMTQSDAEQSNTLTAERVNETPSTSTSTNPTPTRNSKIPANLVAVPDTVRNRIGISGEPQSTDDIRGISNDSYGAFRDSDNPLIDRNPDAE